MICTPKIKLWLSTEEHEGVFGDGKFRLLNSIETHGSLRAAAEVLKISYRKAWGDIKKAEKGLGRSLIERRRGGAAGGSTTLTPEGKKLIAAYSDFRAKTHEQIARSYEETMKDLIDEIF